VCGVSVAVANALPSLKAEVDLVTAAPRGEGVAELARRLLAEDLADEDLRARRGLEIGTLGSGAVARLAPHGGPTLVVGTSGGGKSTAAQTLIERSLEAGYQCCVIDPEGDFTDMDGLVDVGSGRDPPTMTALVHLLEHPDLSTAVNLLAVPLADRPQTFVEIHAALMQTRARTGRPHWLVVDEAHHMLPAGWAPAAITLPTELPATVLITLEVEALAAGIVDRIETVIAVGDRPEKAIEAFCTMRGYPAPPAVSVPEDRDGHRHSLFWRNGTLDRLAISQPTSERRRHTRKYAEGELGPDKSFYFRGPEGRLNLRVQNLALFAQIANGIDDETWLHHLRRRDYSDWFATAIKDEELAEEARRVEADGTLDAASSRGAICTLIEQRYTAPARASRSPNP
jgi:hypothetical protein